MIKLNNQNTKALAMCQATHLPPPPKTLLNSINGLTYNVLLETPLTLKVEFDKALVIIRCQVGDIEVLSTTL